MSRKSGPCTVCVAFGDETDKQIHGLGLCEKHYKAHQRRRQAAEAGELTSAAVAQDRHDKELKAHQFVAEKFQKFLHILNHENTTMVLPVDDIHEIRLIVNPIMVRSQRIAVPRSLPTEMLTADPREIIAGIGDITENFQGTVPTEVDRRVLAARDRELRLTIVRRQRSNFSLAAEIIEAGFKALERNYSEPEAYRSLTEAVKLLRDSLGMVA